MKYVTGESFRQALESRTLSVNRDTGTPIIRLRKMVAFDRFLVRLIQYQPDEWVLKGGFALQLRLGDQARTTKDIDVLFRSEGVDIHKSLQKAGFLDLGDWFRFEIPPLEIEVDEGKNVRRYSIKSLISGRTFEDFHIDVGVGDPIFANIEYLTTSDILTFAGIEPISIPCYPISQQIAEKIHAYTKPRGTGDSTRVKDFVDLLVLAGLSSLNKEELVSSIQVTFTHSNTHSIPEKLPQPPRYWRQTFNKLCHEVGFEDISLNEAYQRLEKFINPALQDVAEITEWIPEKWEWK